MNIERVERVEDAVICRECGGECCKRSPCTYFPEDFGEVLTVEAVCAKIWSGRATLLRVEGYRLRRVTSPIVGDNSGVKVVSLVDWLQNGKKLDGLLRCALLTEAGCSLSLAERPMGGAIYVPRYDAGIVRVCHMPCGASAGKSWLPYQGLLAEVEEVLLRR